jgi:hypothetical protein
MDDTLLQIFITSSLSIFSVFLGIFIKNYFDEKNKKRDYRTKLDTAEFFKIHDKTFFEKIITTQIKEQYFSNEFGILVRHNEDFEKWADIKKAKKLSWIELKKAHAYGYLYLENGAIKKKTSYGNWWFVILLIIWIVFSLAFLVISLFTRKYIALPLVFVMLGLSFYNLLINISSYLLYKKISSICPNMQKGPILLLKK